MIALAREAFDLRHLGRKIALFDFIVPTAMLRNVIVGLILSKYAIMWVLY